MNHSEVRVGNYVLVPEVRVKSSIPSLPKKILGITCTGEIEVKTEHYDITQKIPCKYCGGIPLSKEHLEYLGFVMLNNFQFVHKVMGIQLEDCHDYFIWSIHRNLNVRIDYVHQLQNLFADITMQNYYPDFKTFFQNQHELTAV